MSKLSQHQILILDLIRFRTNNKNYIFYGSNEYIANCCNLKKSSVKVMVNKLIKEGYLNRTSDKKHKRILSLSGKEYPRMFWENMSNVNKWGIKKELEEMTKEWEIEHNDYYVVQSKNDRLEERCHQLEMENYELRKKIKELENGTPIEMSCPQQAMIPQISVSTFQPKPHSDVDNSSYNVGGELDRIMKQLGIQQSN